MAAADVLWANRCFRIPLDTDSQPERALIPVVDLLNHHRDGAVADWTGEDFGVTTLKPFGTNQCALNYGMNRNVLEMAIVYGFLDPDADDTREVSAKSEYDPQVLSTIAALADAYGPTDSARLLGGAARMLQSRP